tara:strand:+ start:676 stop:864 length:189 start_codon:yes stop_codon:yes gene_type:complete
MVDLIKTIGKIMMTNIENNLIIFFVKGLKLNLCSNNKYIREGKKFNIQTNIVPFASCAFTSR